MSAGRQARLFFALWPDVPLRRVLAAAARELGQDSGGRVPPAENLHLTLAFLGEVPAERLAELCELGSAAAGRPFELVIDRIGYWKQQRLVWAGVTRMPPELGALASRLAIALQARGYRVEKRAFRPHVTLLRDAGTPRRRRLDALRWQVRSLVLARSLPGNGGVRYAKADEWPMVAAGAGL